MAELDLAALRERLAGHGVSDVQPLAGGASSLTFRGRLGGRPVVVKVAPPGHAPSGHRDVLRQARVMRILAGTAVPVPEVLFEDAGRPPDVPPLFGMSRAAGEAFEPLFDHVEFEPNRDVPQRYRNAATVMAVLHRLAPADLGLADEPVVEPAAEVERWCATLRTVDQALVPGWSAVAELLRACVPSPMRPSIVHGDFRLGNLLAVDAEIAAVIDWEIWSLGDPRTDLGWFLINAEDDTYRRATPHADLVPRDLVPTYAAAFGEPVPDLPWFMALACFKSAATWSLIVKHNRRRSTPDAGLEQMADAPTRLLQRADAIVD